MLKFSPEGRFVVKHANNLGYIEGGFVKGIDI